MQYSQGNNFTSSAEAHMNAIPEIVYLLWSEVIWIVETPDTPITA